MFKNMMQYKKTWKLFCEWLKKNKMIDDIRQFNINCKKIGKTNPKRILFTLSIMPFFFDEKTNIEIESNRNSAELFDWDNEKEYTIECDRQEALIKVCEKAFEIRENNND